MRPLILPLLLTGLLPALAQDAAKPTPVTQENTKTEAGDWRSVQVAIDKGSISALALCQGVFDAYGMDGKQLRFDDRMVPVDSLVARLMLYGLQKSLRGKIEVNRKDAGRTFELRIQRGVVSSGRRAAKKRILKALSVWTGEDLISRQYHLLLPEDLKATSTLTILVHGLDSRPGFFDDLSRFLTSKGHQTARYSYPNDESIRESAVALSTKLRQLTKKHPDIRLDLIGHSMGGILCREVVEDPSLFVEPLNGVVFLGTPHRGSYLSAYRSVLDVRDNIQGGFTAKALLDTWRDGFGEAGHDLWPGSTYLAGLNKRPRNPKVRYLNLLGNKAPFSRESLDRLAAESQKLLSKTTWGRLLLPRVGKALGDLRELETGKGDCAVALARGHLQGVPEKILPLDHVALAKLKGVLTAKLTPDTHPAWRELLAFLER